MRVSIFSLALLALLAIACIPQVARAQTADADAETADPTANPAFNSILLNNGTKNCVIYSYLGFLFRETPGYSNYFTEWVLSFEFTFLANYGPDRLRFDRGANVVIHQLEKKDQTLSSKESAQDYQKWFIDSDGAIKTVYNNYTLNVEGGNTNPGTRLVMWAGTPGSNEKFYMDANHRICSKMPGSSICLEIIADSRSATDLYVRMGTPINPPAAHQQWFIKCEGKQ